MREQFRDALPGRVVGHQGKRGVALEVIDPPHEREGWMGEGAEPVHALAERRLELGPGGQFRAEPEQLQGGRAGVVEHQQAIAQTVRQALAIPDGEPVRWR